MNSIQSFLGFKFKNNKNLSTTLPKGLKNAKNLNTKKRSKWILFLKKQKNHKKIEMRITILIDTVHKNDTIQYCNALPSARYNAPLDQYF